MVSMVSINGSPRRESRTAVLVDAVAAGISTRLAAEGTAISQTRIDLSRCAPALFAGLLRADLAEAGDTICRIVERADILVVASPVYRASYTGLLKHLFDLVDRDEMYGRKAVLCATGGTLLHGLMIEHQLRPLMGFFRIQTVATTLFALEDDVNDGEIVNAALRERIARATDEMAALVCGIPLGATYQAAA